MTMLNAALAYARHGFPVFPCNPTLDKTRGSKAPLLPKETSPGAKDGGHWLASTDEETVSRWWHRHPNALIGFPTGNRTGAVVIDLDPRNVPVAVMLEVLGAWCGGGLSWVDPKTGEVVSPAIAQTQSGGLHLYFDHEVRTGEPGGNRTGLFSRFIKTGEAPVELDHIDVRGEGGYVIAPPSVMEGGNAYTFLRKPARDETGRWLLPPLPPALRRVVTRERLPREPKREPMPARRRGEGQGQGSVARYVEKRIDGILRSVASAPEGQRASTIFWGACRLGELVLGGFLGLGEARGLLIGNLPAGVSAGEPKALSTIDNGLSLPGLSAWTADMMTRRAA